MTTTRVFGGGVPTEPDVKRLMEAFPSLTPGTILKHGQVSEVIGVTWRTSRYRTICSAWRHRLKREQNVVVRSLPGVGYVVRAEAERVNDAIGDGRRGVRTIGRAVRDIGLVKTEKLPENEQARALHARRLMEGALSSGREAMRQITTLEGEQQRLPRLVKEN